MQSASARLCLGGLVGLMWDCYSAATRGEVEIHLIVSPMPSSAALRVSVLAPGGLGGYPPMIREL